MADVTEQQVQSSAERLLGEKVDSVELVARSSNLVFRLVTDSGVSYSLRVPHLHPASLSPFWQYLQDTFGLRYGTQLLSVGPLADLIQDGGLVQVPRLVASTTVGTRGAYLLTWIDGSSWEPDEFPDTSQAQEQLGEYVARLHLRRYDTYGTLAEQTIDAREFVSRTNASMHATIARCWTHRPDIAEWFDRHARTMSPDVVSGHLSPIMPDISGNQFVYRDGALAGVVDLDSYVVGPRELELATVELSLTRPDAFRRGYEAVLPLPRFDRFRSYCRFWMLVSEGGGSPDLEKFLTCRTHFE